MTKSLTKLIYKPDSQSTDEYIMFVNADEYRKYSSGDSSVPIVEVVDSYDVFFSTQGNQGKLGKASNQQLESVFNTKNEDRIAEFMLKNGVMQHSERIGAHDTAHLNMARGTGSVDTR
ncbi:SubName: Full=Uncharacterized protein {ECO:0000313/EMBL:CCA68136.1} [Serendipita indica DSM 11827]|uniref:Ribosome maturation protein SDO1/SBDS N-terminal domain-containing protein n=1 Tax=Serendipita indica (strain DSM 11827) TaxID=1109443 RepID=G4TA01_SERID|nr:SubName: Full=Uncharacterized protein {ECO:0000313/EMBL:CCA68136.1} [Serendipita indica DSM 11827]CCA68136.1 hypothetical protein PIIN_02003 [Serendipita indica DSM 11827]